MPIKIRVLQDRCIEKLHIYRPFHTVEWYGMKFNYVQDKGMVYILEDSTGRAVGHGTNRALASKMFNKLRMDKSPEQFREAINRHRKVPHVRELI